METPARVLVHNTILGMKGTEGTLLRISSDGYYELNCSFGNNVHRVMLPIHQTVLIARDPEAIFESGDDVER